MKTLMLPHLHCPDEKCREPVMLTTMNTEIIEYGQAPGFYYVHISHCQMCGRQMWVDAMKYRQEAEAVGAKVVRLRGEPRANVWNDFHQRTGIRKWWRAISHDGEAALEQFRHELDKAA